MIYAHSGIRYLVLLFGAATLLYALFGVATGRPYDKRIRILAALFAGSLHLNLLLGFGLIFMGSFYPSLIGHVIMMVGAAVVAQIVPSVMRRRPEEERTFLPHAVNALIALALVIGGIMAIARPIFGSAYS
jgi:xanthine/uracil permease